MLWSRAPWNGHTLSLIHISLPYPGFPTDMQPQMAACLCLAKDGTSIINEGIWENRYRYVDEFKRMGAEIQVDGKVAVVEGVGQLTGAPLRACDLRAGAAMVIAGLAASGTTEISCIHYICLLYTSRCV